MNNEQQKKEKVLMTQQEVMDLLGVSRNVYYDLKNSGKLPPAINIGMRNIRYRRSDIMTFIDRLVDIAGIQNG